MVEPDIVVDKRSHLELLVVLDRKECDWVFEDHSIQVVGAVKGETVETKGNEGGDGSNDQEGMGATELGQALYILGLTPNR